MTIHELRYGNTNTYLIEGERGIVLFDTCWAGTFDMFCRAMGELRIPVQKIDAVLISHFHPDHCGIAQEIADHGAVIAVADVQKEYVHAADDIFRKENRHAFRPIDDAKVRVVALSDSRRFLEEFGIEGELLHTPGHSDDSITLALDDGSLFVGDLNPLYELEMHRGTQIGESWEKLLSRKPRTVYYGHAKTAVLGSNPARDDSGKATAKQSHEDLAVLVASVVRYIDKGWDAGRIQRKTGADAGLIEDVMRMYLTHRNIGIQGILDRIEIKNK